MVLHTRGLQRPSHGVEILEHLVVFGLFCPHFNSALSALVLFTPSYPWSHNRAPLPTRPSCDTLPPTFIARRVKHSLLSV